MKPAHHAPVRPPRALPPHRRRRHIAAAAAASRSGGAQHEGMFNQPAGGTRAGAGRHNGRPARPAAAAAALWSVQRHALSLAFVLLLLLHFLCRQCSRHHQRTLQPIAGPSDHHGAGGGGAAAGWCPLACPAPRARTARIDKGDRDAPVHSRGASPLGPQPREGQPAGEGVVLAGGARRRRRRYWRRGRARHQGGPTRAYDFPYAYAARCCCSCCCFLPMPAHLLTPIAAATAMPMIMPHPIAVVARGPPPPPQSVCP